MSWVTCEPKSTIRILSCSASGSKPAPGARGESTSVISTLCAGRGLAGQGRRFCHTARYQAYRIVPMPAYVALAVIAAPLLDPFQAPVRIGGLVRVVLIEASVQPGLSRRLA